MNYYNEHDSFAAEWLENLIAAGLIPQGFVDRRSIKEVQPDDLRGYEQSHFFCGIAGWPEALRLAGFAGQCWTGSCPCQPFSAAGKRKGTADERHLWPEFFRLIAACKPTVIFGEQVASKDGRDWLAGVRADLEAVGYEVGAADLCAAGIGAPHIRQRLYWVANSNGGKQGDGSIQRSWQHRQQPQDRITAERMGYPGSQGLQVSESQDVARAGRRSEGRAASESSFSSGPWGDSWLVCRDGKARRVEPSIQPLAHGISKRMGKLRGFGNAIVPQVAAEFIGAFMEANQ